MHPASSNGAFASGDALRPRSLRFSLFSLHDNYAQRRSVARFYDEVMEQCVQAEALGYHAFFLAEHHFRENGTCPNPAVFLAAAAMRTRRLLLGPAVSVLPLRDPRTVAEDYLMLDTLSGGRCLLGVGSGAFRWEFAGFGIDFESKRERFEESLAILRQAITGGTIRFTGRHLAAQDIVINVPPLEGRRPHMPLYVGGLTLEAARSIGRAGDNLMTTPFISLKSADEIGGVLAAYRLGLAECPHARCGNDTALLMHCHVAVSDAEARARAAGPFQTYIDGRVDPRAPRRSYDDLVDSGMALFGSVERVAEAVLCLHERGAGQIILFMNFGAMPPLHVMQSMELFATRVAPMVHAEVARRTFDTRSAAPRPAAPATA